MVSRCKATITYHLLAIKAALTAICASCKAMRSRCKARFNVVREECVIPYTRILVTSCGVLTTTSGMVSFLWPLFQMSQQTPFVYMRLGSLPETLHAS